MSEKPTLGDNESMIDKISKMGHYFIKIEPSTSIQLEFEELDDVIKESLVGNRGREFPGFHNYGQNSYDCYICNTHRIYQHNSERDCLTWSCTKKCEFEMYYGFGEDIREDTKKSHILDVDNLMDTITLIVLFAQQFAENIKQNVTLQITMKKLKNRQLAVIYNPSRDLSGNYSAHTQEIDLEKQTIKLDSKSQEIKSIIVKIIRGVFYQFQLLDRKEPHLDGVILKFINKNYPSLRPDDA